MASRIRSAVFVSYNGLLDPLGSSQILPYLERLHPHWPVRIVSFERPDRLQDTQALQAMEQRLGKQNIVWFRKRYHKWPSLPATTYDLMMGVRTVRSIMSRENVGLIHARGYLPMEIAVRAANDHTPVLFDIRGMQPDEYVDGGVWREGELKWRLAKASERTFFRRADEAVVLTQNIRPHVLGRFAEVHRVANVSVVPCCVDMDRFRFDPSARTRIRTELNVPNNAVLMVYSGSIGTWYLPEAMARFVASYQAQTSSPVHLLWMVNSDRERCLQASAAAGIDPSRIHVLHAAPKDVPGYLSAADVGLALIRPSFSKRGSSPTKYAEYLAVGLPIVIHSGVGDGARVCTAQGAVDVPVACTDNDLVSSAQALAQLLQHHDRAHFRSVAMSLFDLESVAMPTYKQIYTRLLGAPHA